MFWFAFLCGGGLLAVRLRNGVAVLAERSRQARPHRTHNYTTTQLHNYTTTTETTHNTVNNPTATTATTTLSPTPTFAKSLVE